MPPPAARPPLRLDLPPVAFAPQATAPQTVMLKLLEVLRVIRQTGGLPLTKGGEYNRNAFKRLQKRLPSLPDAEFWIEVCQLGGLLEEQGETLRPTRASGRLPGSDPAEVRRDLPGGGERLYATSRGVHHVFVGGEEVVAGGAMTARRPGTVLRSGRDTETVTLTR